MNTGIKYITKTAIINIFMLLAAASAFGQTVLVADSYTSLTSANGNFGTNPALTVSANNAAFVKFNFAPYLFAGTSADDVSKATVKFYVSKVGSAGKIDLYPVLADWDEKTLTANNAPALGQIALTTPPIGKDAQGNYVTIDITELFKQWLGDGQNALPNYGFALAPHPTDANTPQLIDISFDSKENSQTSHEASLALVLKKAETGLRTVATDQTLDGDGTAQNPLGVAPNAITEAYLANNAVTTAKLSDGAVTAAKLADNAVNSAKLADNSVTSADLANSAVTATKLADGAVVETKIASGAVTPGKIAVPMSLTSANPVYTVQLENTAGGAALQALGAINSTTQYNLGGQRVLANPGSGNIFAGANAGLANTGESNSFFGSFAGRQNTTGSYNSFFGADAGRSNVGGSSNSFFGMFAGRANTSGSENAFYGMFTGLANTTGNKNSFFGASSGSQNTTGAQNAFFGNGSGTSNNADFNSFFGQNAGNNNTTGSANTFVGWSAGLNARTGSSNTFVGETSGFDLFSVGSGSFNTLIGSATRIPAGVSFSTAIGHGARVTQDSSLVLGNLVTNVGVGTTAPKAKFQVSGGKIYVESSGQGVILKSPNGSCFELTVTDAGAFASTPVACP